METLVRLEVKRSLVEVFGSTDVKSRESMMCYGEMGFGCD